MHAPAPSLRTLVAGHRPRCPRDGYPDHVREVVVRHVRAEVASGRTLASIAREVGLPAPTIGRWLDAERDVVPGPGFVRVVLNGAASRAGQPQPHGAHASLTLLTPGGYRVEGLDVDALRDLLAVLP